MTYNTRAYDDEVPTPDQTPLWERPGYSAPVVPARPARAVAVSPADEAVLLPKEGPQAAAFVDGAEIKERLLAALPHGEGHAAKFVKGGEGFEIGG